MAEITAALVKELRDKTNAGMMDCKKALKETNGNLEEAILFLREKGIAKAAAKADRAANQGIIASGIMPCGRNGILLEVNCETDFVAKNDNFRQFVSTVNEALLASNANDLDAALKVSFAGGTMEEFIKAKVIEIGENMMLRKFTRYTIEDGVSGVVASYIHMGGKVGVLLKVVTGKEETVKNEQFLELVKDLTLHIAAAAPRCLGPDDLDAEFIAQEQEIARKQLLEEGKPENLIEKILPGKLKALQSMNCLLCQAFIKNDKLTVGNLLKDKSKELGDTISIASFELYKLGL